MTSTWTLAYDQFDPEQEGQREALCTLGNGYLATRGAAPESRADGVHYPGTYVVGVYNRLTGEADGNPVEFESIVNVPNWLPLTWRIDGGDWFDLGNVTILDFRQELDLQRGILTRSAHFQDKQGRRTRLTDRRFVHLCDQHLAGLETTIVAENWSGHVEVCSAIDGKVENTLVADDRQLGTRHLEFVDAGNSGEDATWLKARTNQSRIEVDVAARTRIMVDGRDAGADGDVTVEDATVARTCTVDLAEGGRLVVEKIAAVYTSRDRAISEGGLAAQQAALRAASFDALCETHVIAWEHLWRRCGMELEDDTDETQRIVRLHLFHILQTTSPNILDLDVGVPARGWTGEAYRGHIFWDELFVVPYLNFHLPEVSRSLLLYRYRRLGEARFAARQAGYQGAMFPWRSGSSGREETPPVYLNTRTKSWIPDSTYLQRHIGAAIAYNVWQYYEVTGALDFLSRYGAEMLLEIARFWASIATYNEERERYEIHRVIGPDEFHTGYPWTDEPGLSNNTYTNVMAVWTLCRARDVLDRLPEWRRQELIETLGLTPEEIERWEDISRRMRVVIFDGGILAQFEGYDRLEELDWDAYKDKYGDLQRLDYILDEEGDTPNRYKLSKQPDVLMLFYLFSADELRSMFERLGYPFDDELIPRNVEYYLQRSSQGSTLSRVVAAEIMARLDRAQSWQWLDEALQSDVADIQGGSTAEGIHLGAMAGTIDMLERCYTGVEARGDVLRFDPGLPPELHRLSIRLFYRHCWLDATITNDRLQVRAQPDALEGVTIAFGDQTERLEPGTSVDWPL